MINFRVKVQLSVLGSSKDYLEIDRILETKGKHYARKGFSVENRAVAKQNVWTYWGDEPDENSDFDAQWLPISTLIAKQNSNIMELGKISRVQIAVIVHAFRSFPAFNISNEVIKSINSIGASLDIDLYGSLDGEEF